MWGLIWNFLKPHRYHRNNVRTYETGGGLTLWRTLQLATRLTEALEPHGVDVQQLGGRRPRCTKPCQAIVRIYDVDLFGMLELFGSFFLVLKNLCRMVFEMCICVCVGHFPFWRVAFVFVQPYCNLLQVSLCDMNLPERSLCWIYQNFKAFGCLEVAHASYWNSPKPASSLTRSCASKWFNRKITPKWSKMHSQYVVKHSWDDTRNRVHQAFYWVHIRMYIYIDLLGLSTVLRLLIKWGCSTCTWTILNPQSTLYTVHHSCV